MTQLDLEDKRKAARATKRAEPKLGEVRTYYGTLSRADGETFVDYERGSSCKFIDDDGTVIRVERDQWRVCGTNVGGKLLLLGPWSAGVDAVAVAEIIAIRDHGMRAVVRRVPTQHGGQVPLGKITLCDCSGLEMP